MIQLRDLMQLDDKLASSLLRFQLYVRCEFHIIRNFILSDIIRFSDHGKTRERPGSEVQGTGKTRKSEVLILIH